MRSYLNSLFPLLLVAAFIAGCGGGGGGSTPGGGGGGSTHTSTPTPTPQPTGPALNGIAAIVPNGLPNASAIAPPIPSANFANGLSSGPFVYSGAGKVTYGSGSPPLTVTDNDTSGSTCLVYEAAGASSATPCPFAASTSSVTLTSANDGYAVLYNGKFLAGGALTISAPSFTSLTVSITPTAIAIGPSMHFTGGKTPDGALVYESLSQKLFVAVSDPANPLYAVPYSTTTGYGTPAEIAVQSVNGAAATTLSGIGNGTTIEGGAHDFAIDSQGNIWFTENNGRNSTQYVAVYVQHGSEVNPSGGTVTPGAGGAFVEYTLLPADGAATRTLASIAIVGNYVYTIDENGGLWRIDMTSGNVNPNLGTAYTGSSPAFPANAASELTDVNGANSFDSVKGYFRITNTIVLNNSLWMAEDGHGHLVQVTIDESASPSAGVCNTAGPPPCIGYYQVSATPQQCPNGVFTDGMNLYVPDCFYSKLYEYSPVFPYSQSSSVTMFNGTVQGGLRQTPDKWFWTAVSNGLAAVESMSSTTAGPATALNSACTNSNPNFRANGIIIGPDNTLLYSPSSNNNGTTSVVCGVVY